MSSTPDMLSYIKQTIPDLNHNDLVEILRIIRNSVTNDKIITKGGGTQIKIKDLPLDTVLCIYTFVTQKMKDKSNMLMMLTSE